jgi:hypothetical protein
MVLSMNAFAHQHHADRSLRPGTRTLRRRHCFLVKIPGNRVRGLALRTLALDRPTLQRATATDVV